MRNISLICKFVFGHLTCFERALWASFSPVHTVLLGQAGDWGRFTGRLTSGPTVLSGCCSYGIDLSIVGGVFIQVLDLQLATSHSYLIPHYALVTDNLLEEEETDRQTMDKKRGIRKSGWQTFSCSLCSLCLLYFTV